MKVKRMVFVAVVFWIALLSYFYMNKNYDPLARYPYPLTTEQHDLVVSHLTSKEIDYLIEYAIAPEHFIDLVSEPGFNVYYLDRYDEAIRLYGSIESKEMLVRLINCTAGISDESQLSELIDNYYIFEIVQYYEANPNGQQLLIHATDLALYLGGDTVGYYTPKDLVEVALNPLTSKTIQMRASAAEALRNLYHELSDNVRQSYRKLRVDAGYLSYDELTALYAADPDPSLKPGSSEHQLGLAVDFSIDKVDPDNFSTNELAVWLVENSFRFGFIQTEPVSHPNHFRYVGIEVAEELKAKGITLSEYRHE